MRQVIIAVMIAAMALYGYASSESSKKEVIQWLSQFPNHGIDVQPEHWAILGSSPSKAQIQEITDLYIWKMSVGQLNKHYYQPGWTINDRISNPKYSGLAPDLEQIQPNIPQYRDLIKALKKLKTWKKDAYRLFPNDLVLFDGDKHSSVKLLSQWLEDLDLADNLPDDKYSQAHKDVLTKVQQKYKLILDGRLGNRTRQALLSITNERIRLIKANLERLRWLPDTLSYPRVWVDIAAYQASYQRSATDKVDYNIIVGTPQKQSPVLESEINAIAINPIWKVPHSIARSLLQKEQQHPGFFNREDFKIYKNWDIDSPEIAASTINWNNVLPRQFHYRLEQQPGKLNRLGKFKLNFKNSFGVYLHDTDKPELFKKDIRPLSSGCIRVENILGMIEMIAKEQGLTNDLNAALEIQQTTQLTLKKKVPIYTVYFTAWPDNTGRVRFREDIYQLDNALVSEF